MNPTIYLDENVPKKLREGFKSINKSKNEKINISTTALLCGSGTKDEELIEKIGNENNCLVSYDKRMIFQYSHLIKNTHIGLFIIQLPKNYKYWHLVKSLINNWEIIKENSILKKPFICIIKYRTVKPVFDFIDILK